jgi:hypothetical protein
MNRRLGIAAVRKLAPLCVALAVLLVAAGTASACPGCKDALAANDNQGGNLVAGYFWSILFMMSMPFIIVTTFGGSMYLSVRRARAAQAAQQLAQAQQAASTQRPEPSAAPAQQELIEV